MTNHATPRTDETRTFGPSIERGESGPTTDPPWGCASAETTQSFKRTYLCRAYS